MGTPLDLRGALTKLEWAQQHVERLREDVVRWATRRPYPPIKFAREFNVDRQFVSFTVKSVRPIRNSWSLMVGDACNNYRSALDHLAWQLVTNGRLPNPKRPDLIGFPIVTTTRQHFMSSSRTRKLPGVPVRVLDTLSAYQPYASRRAFGSGWPLEALGEFTRRDKHRELLVTVLRPNGFEVTYPQGSRIRNWIPPGAGGPFEPGAEVLRVYVAPWPRQGHPDVNVYFDAPTQIAIEEHQWLLPTLGAIDRVVSEVLGAFVGR